MGILKGLSKDNCLYEDVRKVILLTGEKVYITDKYKKVFLTKRLDKNTFSPNKLRFNKF